MKTYSATALLLIALCSTPVYAAEPDLLTASSLFTQMDSDKDGVIKPNEINKQSILSSEFAEVDSNSDGALDLVEFEIFIAKVDI